MGVYEGLLTWGGNKRVCAVELDWRDEKRPRLENGLTVRFVRPFLFAFLFFVVLDRVLPYSHFYSGC